MLGRRDGLGAREQRGVTSRGEASLAPHEPARDQGERDHEGGRREPHAGADRVERGRFARQRGWRHGDDRRGRWRGRCRRGSGSRCCSLGRRSCGFALCRTIAEHDHAAFGLNGFDGAQRVGSVRRRFVRRCLCQGACVQHGISPVRKTSVHGTLRVVQRRAALAAPSHRQRAKWRAPRTRRCESEPLAQAIRRVRGRSSAACRDSGNARRRWRRCRGDKARVARADERLAPSMASAVARSTTSCSSRDRRSVSFVHARS